MRIYKADLLPEIAAIDRFFVLQSVPVNPVCKFLPIDLVAKYNRNRENEKNMKNFQKSYCQ
jgi:hypothetical protein